MPLITAIKPQKRKDFFNIFLDGYFSFSISALGLSSQHLKVGQEIAAGQVVTISDEALVSKMFERTLFYLSRRPHSKFEIETYLKKKFSGRVKDSVFKRVILKLENYHLIDDEEFTRWLFEGRRHGPRAKGERFIRAELYKKKIPKEIIDKVLKGEGSTDWRSIADDLARKKLSHYKNLGFQDKRKKIISFLLRRGFDWELVSSVVDEALKDR